MDTSEKSGAYDLAPEEAGRLAVYSFLARALARPVSRDELAFLSPMAGTASPLNAAIGDFCAAVEATPVEDLTEHYNDLFIGLGRGELLPYASYYLTGFLNEKPLAELRETLARLGFARREEVKDPEDHIASLCDVMAQLIGEVARGGCSMGDQKSFFSAHIETWAPKFFADLETAETAGPYRHVGTTGRLFMDIEEAGFAMLLSA